MSKSFYPKMALSNISKNRKTYFPYIITCILTIMMYFMMGSILHNENVRNMNHGENVVMLLNIGMAVTGIFSVIFLFYTNSFLIKRRQKEIGLYNILGMEKRHIGRMMFFETLITAVISILIGILMGVLFGKLMFLLLFKLIGASEQVPAFQVPAIAIVNTLITFAAVFFAILLYNLAKIHLTNPIELVHGGQIGEKEPKTKILLTIVGILTMGAGYAFALLAKTPFEAMSYFFLAVIMVIIGTYCLFTAGSIALIKMLRKNKRFYYQTKHFTSVSGMLYRMKQNAVGLANICILSTMVLVSVSTTVSMYLGMSDTLKTAYPNEVNLTASFYGEDSSVQVDEVVKGIVDKYGAKVSDYSVMSSMSMFNRVNQDHDSFEVLKDMDEMRAYSDGLAVCLFVSVDEFNRMEGTNYQLNSGEVIAYYRKGYESDRMNLTMNGQTKGFKVVDHIEDIKHAHLGIENLEQIYPCYVMLVDSKDTLQQIISEVRGADSENRGSDSENALTQTNRGSVTLDYTVMFDTNLSEEQSIKMTKELDALALDGMRISANNRYDMKAEFHQMYGGFLFIGMFVGTLFLMATVLIIYYKQISEGYEDKTRFEIMQKVGMSKSEVKKTIRSQVLMVFFIPLIMATIHVLVSFRIIKMILSMLNLGNVDLFLWCTICTVFVFCIIYAVVFAITEKAYYKIVSTSM